MRSPPLPASRSARLIRGTATALLLLGAGLLLSALPACSPSPPPGPRLLSTPVEEEYKGPPHFEDVTAASGVAFTYRNGEEAGHFAIIESLGGGVALLDYDHDGLLDVFVPGGGFYEGKKVRGHPCRLFRNRGGFKFTDVSAQAGLDGIDFPYSHGGAAFDYDCDGWLDILVSGYNRLVLLHNESAEGGGRRFVDVTSKAKLDDNLWSTSAGWGDLDGDGYPELYVAHYGDWGFETNHPTDCTYDGKTRDVCQPRKFKPLPHTLYRNNRDGTFSDISAQVKLRKDGKGIGVLIVDVNNDSRPDIYAANDTDDNFLYLNRGKPGEIVLEEVGLLVGVARDDRGLANGSMGVDAGDFQRSGRASLLVTNYENELPALYRNNQMAAPSCQFTYDTLAAGIAVIGGNYVSWGTGFLDYDLDGWEDLVIVSGHAIRFPTKLERRQKAVLLRNTDGRFKSTTNQGGSYFRDMHNARGLALGDLDNDGRPDLVVSHLNEPVSILRNVAAAGQRWVGLELHDDQHRDIVGARVVVESAGGSQTRFVRGGGSYATTNDSRLLFGLGTDEKITTVKVVWPDGQTQEVSNIQPGAYWRLTKGRKDASRVEPGIPPARP